MITNKNGGNLQPLFTSEVWHPLRYKLTLVFLYLKARWTSILWKNGLSLLEGYFSIQKFSNSEQKTFMLPKSLPHAIGWWDTYCELHVRDYSTIVLARTHLGNFCWCPLGTIRPWWKLWCPIHEIDNSTSGERLYDVKLRQNIPYLVHKDGY